MATKHKRLRFLDRHTNHPMDASAKQPNHIETLNNKSKLMPKI